MDALTIAQLLKDTGFHGAYAVGVRGLTTGQGLGALPSSSVWSDDVDPQHLSGTSTIGLAAVNFDDSIDEISEILADVDIMTAIATATKYAAAGRVGLVVGIRNRNDAECDVGEWLLTDAECVAIL